MGHRCLPPLGNLITIFTRCGQFLSLQENLIASEPLRPITLSSFPTDALYSTAVLSSTPQKKTAQTFGDCLTLRVTHFARTFPPTGVGLRFGPSHRKSSV